MGEIASTPDHNKLQLTSQENYESLENLGGYCSNVCNTRRYYSRYQGVTGKMVEATKRWISTTRGTTNLTLPGSNNKVFGVFESLN
jgi:hypothetical protein